MCFQLYTFFFVLLLFPYNPCQIHCRLLAYLTPSLKTSAGSISLLLDCSSCRSCFSLQRSSVVCLNQTFLIEILYLKKNVILKRHDEGIIARQSHISKVSPTSPTLSAISLLVWLSDSDNHQSKTFQCLISKLKKLLVSSGHDLMEHVPDESEKST